MSAQKPLPRPPGTDLSNWRTPPYSRWAFQHVRQFIPSASIACGNGRRLPENTEPLPSRLILPDGTRLELTELLADTETDSLLVLRNGEILCRWAASHTDLERPHIVFSISKSITAMLAGVLVKQGIIDIHRTVCHYLPDCRGSAYEDATLQNLLDMNVALDFTEDYLNPDGDYFRYRNATCWNPVDQTTASDTLEPFLYSLQKAGFRHGDVFNYKSPNTDILGLVLERAADQPYAELLSGLVWKPLGTTQDAYVTLERGFLARSAGGICTTIEDLARFGQMMIDEGAVGSQQVIPESWVADTRNQGNMTAWQRGDFRPLLPDGCYRNNWYQLRDADRCFLGLGIHGQWLFLNPTTRTVIARLSSQTQPLDETLDTRVMAAFKVLSRHWD